MTSRQIVAVFDSRDAAQRARESLLQLGLPREEINIVDQGSSELQGDSTARHEGLWAHIKHMFVPDEDRETLDEHLRRGGYVLSSTIDETRADAAIDRLEDAGAVDLDEREAEWRSSGWPGSSSTESSSLSSAPSASATAASATSADSAASRARSAADGEGVERIPVVEEQLVVGKREVNRGGVRVRSYVREEPAHADVRLRDEHIEVERHPVDEPATPVQAGSADDLMRERTVDVTETDEEAVVGKQARVKEEVVVKKTAEERVQPIDDTVRRTEVNVERLAGDGAQSETRASEIPQPRTDKPQPRGRT